MRGNARRTENVLFAGIDEAGRGPLAGPVTAACVVLPPGFADPRITDSKVVRPALRAELAKVIIDAALAYHIVSVGPRRIEKLNILQATILAMRLCAFRVSRLLADQDLFFLVDGNRSIGNDLPHQTIIKGDAKEPAISAASILAKVTRDRIMERVDLHYPGYGFAAHKGYGAPAHLAHIAELGPCRIHRTTFAGVKEHIVKEHLKENLRQPALQLEVLS